jgi:hypothetical protein
MWNFDATGNVLSQVVGQKKPFLYSIVTHDAQRKIILNLADFVTTAHTTTSIALYLMLVKDTYAKFNCKAAPIFCTDFSWPNISAALRVFNLCSVSQYLEWCFGVMVEKDAILLKRIMPVRVILCCSHFLKLVIKHGKKVKCEDERIRKTFYFSFSMLQNALSIDEFNVVLINTAILFSREFEDAETLYAYQFLKNQIESRDIVKSLNFYKISNKIKNDNEYPSEFFDPLNYQNETTRSIKSGSKFAPYFDELLGKVTKTNGTAGTVNMFYSPDLFAIVVQWLHLVPFWTSMITSDLYDSNPNYQRRSRHSNNYVENWFDQIKNKFLRSKKVMPSVLGTELYGNLETKFFEHYEDVIILPEKKDDK